MGAVTEAPGAVLATAPVLRHAPAATNLIIRSEKLDTNWQNNWSGGVTLTQPSVDRYDGLSTSWLLNSKASAIGGLQLVQSLLASTQYTLSCFVKESDAATINLRLYDSTGGTYPLNATFTWVAGDLTTDTLTTGSAFTVEESADGWWRATVTGTTIGANSYAAILFPSTNWANTYGTYMGGVQLETGGVATPLVPTTGSAGTRLIDSILYPYSASVFDQDQGSIVFKIKLKPGTFTPATSQGLVGIDASALTLLYLNTSVSVQAKTNDSTNSPKLVVW